MIQQPAITTDNHHRVTLRSTAYPATCVTSCLPSTTCASKPCRAPRLPSCTYVTYIPTTTPHPHRPAPTAAANAAKLAAITQQLSRLQEQLTKEQTVHSELQRQHEALTADVHARATHLHSLLAKHADMVQPVTQWTQVPLVD